MTDDEARQVLDQLRRHPAVTTVREAVDHALVALADRAALCAEQSSHELYDATIAARRHMEGKP